MYITTYVSLYIITGKCYYFSCTVHILICFMNWWKLMLVHGITLSFLMFRHFWLVVASKTREKFRNRKVSSRWCPSTYHKASHRELKALEAVPLSTSDGFHFSPFLSIIINISLNNWSFLFLTTILSGNTRDILSLWDAIITSKALQRGVGSLTADLSQCLLKCNITSYRCLLSTLPSALHLKKALNGNIEIHCCIFAIPRFPMRSRWFLSRQMCTSARIFPARSTLKSLKTREKTSLTVIIINLHYGPAKQSLFAAFIINAKIYKRHSDQPCTYLAMQESGLIITWYLVYGNNGAWKKNHAGGGRGFNSEWPYTGGVPYTEEAIWE